MTLTMRTLLLTSCLFIILSPSHYLSHAIPTTTPTNLQQPPQHQQGTDHKTVDEKSQSATDKHEDFKTSQNLPSVSSPRSKRHSSGYVVEDDLPQEFLESRVLYGSPKFHELSLASPYSLEDSLEQPDGDGSYVISFPDRNNDGDIDDDDVVSNDNYQSEKIDVPLDLWLPELLASDSSALDELGNEEDPESELDGTDKRAREFIGKRAREFIGKRAREFIGKRAREFIGKRAREFIGKRAREFIGKRAREFIGKRAREFIGKRSDDVSLDNVRENVIRNMLLAAAIEKHVDEKRAREFIGKRAREFIGKRAREFIGKRAREFIGKRAREFIGKRAREFIGKRAREFIGKRARESSEKRAREFIGKRAREFIGKRAREFIGKRPREFIGKRAREFIGKRAREFIGKRAREFIGKRDGQLVEKRPREFIGKRAREFIGKRDGDYKFGDDFLSRVDPLESSQSAEDDPFSFLRADVDNVKPNLDNLVFPSMETSSEEMIGSQSYPIDEEENYLQAVKRPREFIGKRSEFEEVIHKRPREFIGKRSAEKSEGDFVGDNSLSQTMGLK